MVVRSFLVFSVVIFVGGAIFMRLEHEEARKILSPRREIAAAKAFISENSNMTKEEIEKAFMKVEKAIQQNGVKEPYSWNYYESCFFVGSLLTTIGYGHIAPKTAQGQAFTILYGLFGIPLTVLVVRNMGKRITEIVVYIVRFICTMSDRLEDTNRRKNEANGSGKNYNCNVKVKSKRKSNSFISSSRKIKIACVVVLFLMVVTFLILSAVLRIVSEGWTMQQSIYFWFITLTTVGLGDYVPYEGRKPTTTVATIVYYSGIFYLIFGLALIASLFQCISVMLEGKWPGVPNEVSPNPNETADSSKKCHDTQNPINTQLTDIHRHVDEGQHVQQLNDLMVAEEGE